MTIEIPVGEIDDPYFVALVSAIANSLASQNEPNELWVVRIDNWFDHKWLGFSGIGVVDFSWFGLTDRFDAALDEFHQDRLTFPPFHPSRVSAQWSFARSGDQHSERPLPRLPHRHEKRSSSANLLRRVENLRSSATFLWFSSNTVANGRGSVMVYEVADGSVVYWFASFSRRKEWTLHATKNISREDVLKLLRLVS